MQYFLFWNKSFNKFNLFLKIGKYGVSNAFDILTYVIKNIPLSDIQRILASLFIKNLQGKN